MVIEIKKIRKVNKFFELVFSINGEELKTKVTDNFLVRNNMLKPRIITNDEYKLLLLESFYIKCINKISKRMFSTYEMKEYLKRLKLTSNEIEVIINQLLSDDLLNDYLYSKYLVNQGILSMKGPIYIKHVLEQKSLNTRIVDELYTKDLISQNKMKIKEKYNTETEEFIFRKLYSLGYIEEY